MKKLISLILFATLSSTASADFKTLIYGGAKVQKEDPLFASMVSIVGYNISYGFCSGILIAQDLVLTAAHCVAKNHVPVNPETLSINHSTVREPMFGPSRDVEEFIIHPDYLSTNTRTQAFAPDLAIIRLSKPFSNTKPMPLHPKPTSLAKGEDAWIYGYGSTFEDGAHQGENRNLNKIKKKIVSLGRQIAFSQFDDTGLCFGDSGGPVLSRFENKTYLIGINSAVLRSQDKSKPCSTIGFAQNLGPLYSWIEESVKALNDGK